MAYAPSAYTPGTSRSLDPEQIAHLQEASLAITESLETDEVVRRVVASARALIGADSVVLFGIDPHRADYPLLASDGLRAGHGTQAAPYEAAVGKAIKERHVIGVEDLDALPPALRMQDGFAVRQGFRSVLAAPLVAQNYLLGALAVYARDRRVWQRGEATLLSLFAAHAATCLQNARLYERLNRRAADLQALYEISHLYGSYVEPEPLLTAVIARLAGWVRAKYGAVMLVERGENGEAELKIRADYGLTPEYIARANAPGGVSLDARHPNGGGPASISAREARPCAIGDVFVDERFAPFRRYARAAGYLSIVSVPIRSNNHVRGSIVLYFAQRRDFPQSEIDLLLSVADGVALALDRMELSVRLVRDAMANRYYEETDRLKAEFVSTVSHELRTPLTIIKGYTDLVVTEQAGPLTETQRKFLLGVQRNTTRLTELVSDLLDISHLETEALDIAQEPLDVGQVTGETCAEYERVAAERNVALACTVSDSLPSVIGDAGRIGQVINNLISNAVKYSPPGGTVTISCEPGDKGVVVAVRDRGPGIPREAQDRLFEKFYRVDSSSTRLVGGTGLGLAIARAIVEQHGGRIWVESEPGAGSTFSFLLPARPAKNSKEASGRTSEERNGAAKPVLAPEGAERK